MFGSRAKITTDPTIGAPWRVMSGFGGDWRKQVRWITAVRSKFDVPDSRLAICLYSYWEIRLFSLFDVLSFELLTEISTEVNQSVRMVLSYVYLHVYSVGKWNDNAAKLYHLARGWRVESGFGGSWRVRERYNLSIKPLLLSREKLRRRFPHGKQAPQYLQPAYGPVLICASI